MLQRWRNWSQFEQWQVVCLNEETGNEVRCVKSQCGSRQWLGLAPIRSDLRTYRKYFNFFAQRPFFDDNCVLNDDNNKQAVCRYYNFTVNKSKLHHTLQPNSIFCKRQRMTVKATFKKPKKSNCVPQKTY